MNPIDDRKQQLTRRSFLSLGSTCLGAAAFNSLLAQDSFAQSGQSVGGLAGLPHFAPKAKRVIYLFQSGGPSQHELWDYKPKLKDMVGEDLPPSVRGNQRVTAMTSGQLSFPLVPSIYDFEQHGQSGAWVSELMPHTAKIVDDLAFIKTMHTEAINHDPGITFFQTGAQLAGRPSIGAWLDYGLGSMNQDLPAFVAMVSIGSGNGGQPLYDRLWGSGFLPTRHQGVKFLASGDPVLYLSNPVLTVRRAVDFSMTWPGLMNLPRKNMAIRKPARVFPNTRWLTGCRLRCQNSTICPMNPRQPWIVTALMS